MTLDDLPWQDITKNISAWQSTKVTHVVPLISVYRYRYPGRDEDYIIRHNGVDIWNGAKLTAQCVLIHLLEK